jgi:O-antigen biosynthesis protein
MYTCHLGIYRRAIVEKIGGFRVGYEGSQDYDLVLRFTEQTAQIFHIPRILYHWRKHAESSTAGETVKPYAYESGRKAIADALVRRGEPGTVTPIPKNPGRYTIRYQIHRYKRVSLIIPTRDLGDYLDRCLTSIFRVSTYPNFEVIVIDNGSTEDQALQVLKEWQDQEPERLQVHTDDRPFNYSQLNNTAVQKATGDFLLFLNNDTEIITPDWIEAMVEQAQRSSIGAVGAKLLYADQTIQHAGVLLGVCGGAGHGHKFYPADEPGYLGQVVCISNYSALTGACLMCRRDVFEQVGGFTESLAVAYNDIDFCLKLRNIGLYNVYVPHAVLYHYESKSRGLDEADPVKRDRMLKERAYLHQTWATWIEADPGYNPHLTRKKEDYSLHLPPDFVGQAALSKITKLQAELNETHHQLELLQSRVNAMETSKFWKLRSLWFQVQRKLGLSTERE